MSELITLSELGLTMILLENELENNIRATARWRRRMQDAEIELQELYKRRKAIETTVEKIKQVL